ncbi:DUF4381 domain-containing protein [Vibrio sp. SS-MA-C1-2]|uniref:DUF4381 domain-containing protein n=1 Tax=Vibrio sp. SS-MA-C1-2 TaxID=2908646 RepID=UPI001F24BCEA|nr:DUF4381 domain-containing protein [Vibrio sp. SS-MA-C1-2]UJF18585.1 DUF4381 domain-containing protein [Vibrio sp. SS-MA-C1-2]
MNNTPQHSGLQLADIHLQSAPNWWPLSLLGWLFVLVILLILAGVGWWLYRCSQQTSARKLALKELKKYQPNRADQPGVETRFNLKMVNRVLKQTILSYYPRSQVASLTGDAWFEYLDQQLKAEDRGFVEYSAVWLQGLYQDKALSQQQAQICWQQAYILIKKADFKITDNREKKESL